jgi:hypothetical protein
MPSLRSSLGTALLGGVLALTAAAAPAHAAASSGPLLVLQAQGLTSRTAADGSTVVVLRDPTRQLTSFTRGARTPKISVTLGELTRQWNALGFVQSPPLATIDPAGDEREATLVRLGVPRLDGDDLVLPVQPAADSTGGALAGRLTDRSADVPDEADSTTVTINATDGDDAGLEAIDDPLVPNRDGEWKEIHTYISAYSDDGSCGRSTWGSDTGSCTGSFNNGGSTAPFTARSARYGLVYWENGTSSVKFLSASNTTGLGSVGHLNGHLPGRASGSYYVDNGWLWDMNNFRVKSGTDAALTGQKGGPLSIDVEYHHPLFGGTGYTFSLDGWLWCMVGDAACHP